MFLVFNYRGQNKLRLHEQTTCIYSHVCEQGK